jgi:hypothetical protein
MSEALASLVAMDDTATFAPLDPRLKEVLEFERSWWTLGAAAKERAIRRRLGISPARYHQFLNRALDLPEALEQDAVLVLRLRRIREARRRARSGPRLGLEASPR